MTYILHADIKRKKNNPCNYCPEPDHLSKQEHKYYEGNQSLINRKMVNDGFLIDCWFIKGKVFQTRWASLLQGGCETSKVQQGQCAWILFQYPWLQNSLVLKLKLSGIRTLSEVHKTQTGFSKRHYHSTQCIQLEKKYAVGSSRAGSWQRGGQLCSEQEHGFDSFATASHMQNGEEDNLLLSRVTWQRPHYN